MKKFITRRDFLKLAPVLAAGMLFRQESQFEVNDFPKRDTHAKNIIILLFDTMSAKHLSLYGYPRRTTPNLEKFASRAFVYHNHYATGNFTTPGTASIFTGTYPWTHRAFQQGGLILRNLENNNIFRLLDNTYERLAFSQNLWADLLLLQFDKSIDVHVPASQYSVFENIKYEEGFFARNPLETFQSYDDFLFQNYRSVPGSLYFSLVNEIYTTLKSRFEEEKYKYEYPRGIPNLIRYDMSYSLRKVFDGVISEIANLNRPSIAYFHFYPPHEPYLPQRDFIGIFDNDNLASVAKEYHPLADTFYYEDELSQFRADYDCLIANVDHEFGRIYRFMEKSGLLENSCVIITSDHGQLFERGVHGHVTPLMFEPLVKIPLIVSMPGQKKRKDIFSMTSSVDIFPTILNFNNQKIPDWVEGDLLPGLGGIESDDRAVFSLDAKMNPPRASLSRATFAMRKKNYKLIWYVGYPGYDDIVELYDLIDDPDELFNLASFHPDVVESMRSDLLEKIVEADQLYKQ